MNKIIQKMVEMRDLGRNDYREGVFDDFTWIESSDFTDGTVEDAMDSVEFVIEGYINSLL